MINSLRHMYVIAANTFTEAIRQKMVYVLVIFCLVLLAASGMAAQFDFRGDDFKFMKDLAYAAMSVMGLLIALLGAPLLVPGELERRTIYTVLSKPVRRFEFVVGKYCGLVALLTLCLLLMAAVFWLALWRHESALSGAILHASGGHLNELQAAQIQEYRSGAYDPAMGQALLLLWLKLCLLTAISVFFSTIASSTMFIVCCTLLVYLIGHLQGLARDYWLSHSTGLIHGIWQLALGLVALLIPDFQSFNLIDEIIGGRAVSWHYTWQLLGYALGYMVVVLAVSSWLFAEREL